MSSYVRIVEYNVENDIDMKVVDVFLDQSWTFQSNEKKVHNQRLFSLEILSKIVKEIRMDDVRG